jgi:hypothetical protein
LRGADQHQGLELERRRRFTRDQQLLMIANEMHRATMNSFWLICGRVLRLADLTASASGGLGFRREFRRWRSLVAEAYVTETADIATHDSLGRALLAPRGLVPTPSSAAIGALILHTLT